MINIIYGIPYNFIFYWIVILLSIYNINHDIFIKCVILQYLISGKLSTKLLKIRERRMYSKKKDISSVIIFFKKHFNRNRVFNIMSLLFRVYNVIISMQFFL